LISTFQIYLLAPFTIVFLTVWGFSVAYSWAFIATYISSMIVVAAWITSFYYKRSYGRVEEVFERTVQRWGYEDLTRRLKWSVERGDGVLLYGFGGRKVVRRRSMGELRRWTMVWGAVRYEWRIKVERWVPSVDVIELEGMVVREEMEILPKYEPRVDGVVDADGEHVEMGNLHLVVDVGLASDDNDREGHERATTASESVVIPPPSYGYASG
jgi:hypothetical protein